MRPIRATDILWDVACKEELEGLPTEVDIPEHLADPDEIGDWLSDTYGFCHKGFSLTTD